MGRLPVDLRRDDNVGLEALTLTADGTPVIPASEEDWGDWVSATDTRNHARNDALSDWLNLHGAAQGFRRDEDIEGYDPRTDFGRFMMRKGTEFEAAVVEHLRTVTQVHVAKRGEQRSRDLGAAHETFEEMRRGAPVIHQAVLRDPDTRTYGTADLLVRSDCLRRLFPDALTPEAAAVPAPDLGGQPWHYRVIDIKYRTLRFNARGLMGDSDGSMWAYKLQLFIYNRALGRLQGYAPPESFLLGRGWEQGSGGKAQRGTSCMERLGPAPQEHISSSKSVLSLVVDEACRWVRRVRGEGAAWRVLPEPSVPELRPDMGNADSPWSDAKRRIGREQEELTLLWNVGLPKRRQANAAGVFRWTDPACTPEAVGVGGRIQAQTLQAILDINRSDDGQAVRPAIVHAGEGDWRPVPRLEFHVDFETVSDLDDDFSGIPERGGQTLVFMIGCGHLEEGAWRWRCFAVEALTEPEEARIIDAWFAYMAGVKQRLDPDGEAPRVFHWSHAERSSLETAFNSVSKRHPGRRWQSPRWFDLLTRVVKGEPVVVRGSFAFGLKAVAKALHGHGLIDTDWGAGPTDGLGAMTGAWWSSAEAARLGVPLMDIDLMQEIRRYNEVDFRVMMEILAYLRARH